MMDGSVLENILIWMFIVLIVLAAISMNEWK